MKRAIYPMLEETYPAVAMNDNAETYRDILRQIIEAADQIVDRLRYGTWRDRAELWTDAEGQ